MESFTRYIIKRTDGAYINLRWEVTKSIRSAARFDSLDDYKAFLTGYYAPPDASIYYAQPITITYQELSE